MGKQNIKLLVGMIVLSFLVGLGVLVYAYFAPGFNYSIESNLASNSDYYPSLAVSETGEEEASPAEPEMGEE